MGVQKVLVEKGCMLSVLGNFYTDCPYRGQRSVMLVVAFEEYLGFVKIMLRSGMQWMHFSNAFYRKCLDRKDRVLALRLFYRDVSKALVTELILSAPGNREATLIVADFLDGDAESFSLSKIDGALEDISNDSLNKSVLEVNKELENSVSIPNLSKHNILAYKYAVLLRALSLSSKPKRLKVE